MADQGLVVPGYLTQGGPRERSSEEEIISNLPQVKSLRGTQDLNLPNVDRSQGSVPSDVSGGPGSAPVPAPEARPARADVGLPREAYTPARSYDDRDMSWTDYAKGALSNAPQSGEKALMGLYEAVRPSNWGKTGEAIGALGTGIASKASTALGGERISPESEAVVDAIVSDVKERWSDPAKSFYEDPFAIGLDVASVAPVVGPASRLAGLGPVGAGLSKVAALGDPVNLAAKATGLAAKTVTAPVAAASRYAQGAASGVPQSMLKLAEQAGRSGTPAQRNAFTTFATGRGDNRDIAQTAMAALQERKAAVQADYVARKQSLITDELPMNDIKASLASARTAYVNSGLFPRVKDALDEMARRIDIAENSPDPKFRTAVGLDELKRSLNDIVGDLPPSDRGKVADVPRSVRNTIASADSGYADMMERWQDWISEMKDIQTTLGASDRTSETARIAKLLATAKSSDKMALLKELAENTQAGHSLPYMIAGSVAQDIPPPYLRGMGLIGAGAALAGGPHGVAMAAAGSPRLAAMTQYGMGRLAGAAGSIPTPPALATNVLSQIGQEDRIGRKSGGRVGGDHMAAADLLVKAAERAKNDHGKTTEPLLSQSDDAVAHALEVANRSI